MDSLDYNFIGSFCFVFQLNVTVSLQLYDRLITWVAPLDLFMMMLLYFQNFAITLVRIFLCLI